MADPFAPPLPDDVRVARILAILRKDAAHVRAAVGDQMTTNEAPLSDVAADEIERLAAEVKLLGKVSASASAAASGRKGSAAMTSSSDQSMVERVAQAIWHVRESTFPARVRHEPDDFDRASGAWAAVMAQARAAIEAMRGATPAMLKAGLAWVEWSPGATARQWNDMIDAALAEPQPEKERR